MKEQLEFFYKKRNGMKEIISYQDLSDLYTFDGKNIRMCRVFEYYPHSKQLYLTVFFNQQVPMLTEKDLDKIAFAGQVTLLLRSNVIDHKKAMSLTNDLIPTPKVNNFLSTCVKNFLAIVANKV